MSGIRLGRYTGFKFRYDIDTGQKTSDSISMFWVSIESVNFQWMSQKKDLAVGWGKWLPLSINAVCSFLHLALVTTITFTIKFLISLHSIP